MIYDESNAQYHTSMIIVCDLIDFAIDVSVKEYL